MPINAFVFYRYDHPTKEKSQKKLILARKAHNLNLSLKKENPDQLSSMVPFIGQGIFDLYEEVFAGDFKEEVDSSGYFFGNSYLFINAKQSAIFHDESKMDFGIYTICDQLDNLNIARESTSSLLNSLCEQYLKSFKFKDGEEPFEDLNVTFSGIIPKLNLEFYKRNKLLDEKISKSIKEGFSDISYECSTEIENLRKILGYEKNSSKYGEEDLKKSPIKDHFYGLLIYEKKTSQLLFSLSNGGFSPDKSVPTSNYLSAIESLYRSLFSEPFEFFGGRGFKVVLTSLEQDLQEQDKEFGLGIAFICREDDHYPYSKGYSQLILHDFFESYKDNKLTEFSKTGRHVETEFSEFKYKIIPHIGAYCENVDRASWLRNYLDGKGIEGEMKRVKLPKFT